MEQNIYEEMAKQESHHWWFVARRAYLKKLISKQFPPELEYRICEIGCGTGGNLPMLAQLGKVDAVELNESAKILAESKNMNNITGIHSGYLPDAIPLTEQYDGVFSLDVIEHIENDLEAVKALKALLSKNGTLIITVPAYQWLWSAHDDANHHFRRYTRKSFSELIEAAGLNIRYVSYFNTVLFPLAALKRIAEYFLPKKPIENAWDINTPPAWLNTLFEKLFKLECLWAGKLSIPFGLSIVVVAELKK